MLNKAILMGRLTADPELKHTQNNIPVISFTLAVDRTFGKEKQTDFLDIVAWRNTAEFVAKWFSKGMLVAVSGRMQTRTWEDKQGNKRKTTEVVADEVFFAEGKRGQEEEGSGAFAMLPPDEDFLPAGDMELPF